MGDLTAITTFEPGQAPGSFVLWGSRAGAQRQTQVSGRRCQQTASTRPSQGVGTPTSRATGITAYLRNGGTLEGGTLEKVALIANHASTRTTQLYDRRSDEVSLDEVERILI